MADGRCFDQDTVNEIVARLRNDSHWRIEKKIPLALILIFLGQLVAGVWFASAVVTQVNANTEIIAKNSMHRESREPHGEADNRLARLEGAVATLAEATKENTRLQTKILIAIGRMQGIDQMEEQ